MDLNYLTFNDKSSADFGVFISGEATYNTPNRDIELISVPGRNGTLSIDKGRFQNIDIKYPAFIADDFDANFSAMKAYLLSQTGYKKLYDTYHPDHYRLARFNSSLTPEMTQLNRHGKFDLIFDCDPRRFLKDELRAFSGSSIKNPTQFTSKPLIRLYGTGTLTVNDTTLTVNTVDEYVDIDSEIQEAYKGTTNCNGNITVTDFPELTPGVNTISYTGTSISILPNWWTI